MCFGPIGKNLKYEKCDYVYMTYRRVCSPFFLALGKYFHVNNIEYVRESTFLNFATFCDVVVRKITQSKVKPSKNGSNA